MKGTREFGRAFLDGFAQAVGIGTSDADGVWASYSYQLSDTERKRIEKRGWRAGQAEGRKYLRWMKENEKWLASEVIRQETEITYAGDYEIHPNQAGGYSVVRDGQVLTYQPTLEEAMSIVEKWTEEGE